MLDRARAAVERMLRPLRQRIQNLAARAVLKAIDDSGAVQKIQVLALAGETKDFIQRIQQYGFTSVPPVGAQPVILLCPFGDRSQAVAIAVDDTRYRPTGWSSGDSGLYDLRGNRVRLRDGVLEITAAGDLTIAVAGEGQITITSELAVTIGAAASIDVGADAELTVGGNATIEVTGDALLQTGGNLDLGAAGGQPVARVGDSVDLMSGLITSGSAKVKSA